MGSRGRNLFLRNCSNLKAKQTKSLSCLPVLRTGFLLELERGKSFGNCMPKKPQNLNGLLGDLAGGLSKIALNPDANTYQPHAKQVAFHKSQSQGRLYIGGNRSGKTVGGVIECIWWLTHRHPYRATPKGPVRGRLVCVDFPNGWEKIVKPVLTQWIPSSALINGSWDDSFDKRYRTLHLANGSFLEIMSYDQEVEAFAGASLHFIHFDEEPPKEIWDECRMRLMDTGGSWWISMTPVEGMEWIEDDLYEPFVKHGLAEGNSYGVDVIEVNTEENTYLSKVQIDSTFSGMDEEDVKTRKQGKFSKPGGLIYKNFNPSLEGGHVIPSLAKSNIPRNWRIIASMDHGFNNPTSWHWHAISPNGTVITFGEHYRDHWTVKEHAQAIKQFEKDRFFSPEFRIGDPAIKQKSGINGNSIQMEYRLNGIAIAAGNNDVKVGIDRTYSYLEQAKWFISEDCPRLIWELKRYRWKTRTSKKLQSRMGPMDEPHKKDDHAVDDVRYFFTSLPELTPLRTPVDLAAEKKQIQEMLNGKTGFRTDLGGSWDSNISRKILPNKEFAATDEYLGGIW